MNIRSFIFCFLIVLCTPTHAQMPLAFDFAGIKVSANDMATAFAATIQAVEEAAQNDRYQKELAISKLNQELIDLGKKADAKKIGANEYEQNKLILMQALNRLNTELDTMNKSAATLGNNVQNVLMGGWNAMLDRYKEEQQRKTRIAEVAVAHTIENEGALERLRFFSQPENLKQYALFSTAICLGACGSYYGAKGAHHAFMLMLEQQPKLVQETSYHGTWDSILETLPAWLYTPAPAPTFDDTMVLNPELETYLKEIVAMTQTAYDKGLPLQSLLLYGPPGTGKTLYAKLLAKMSGLDYAIASAADLGQFKEGEELKALHELFEWAKNSKKGLVLFLDEIDALGRHRNNLSERWVRTLDTYLQLTGSSLENIMIVGATNRLEDLDPAFVSRFPHKIAITLPGVAERERLLNLYLKKYIIDDTRTIKRNGTKVNVQLKLSSDIDATYIHEIAEKTEGFSGRTVAQLVEALRAQCYLTDALVLTKVLVERELTRIE